MDLICRAHQVVEDGYEFFSKRQLVTLFSAPNYCGEFDNAGAMMSVDESLLCSFQVGHFVSFPCKVPCPLFRPQLAILSPWDAVTNRLRDLQILKPAEKKQKYVYGGMSTGRPVTPPRKQKKK